MTCEMSEREGVLLFLIWGFGVYYGWMREWKREMGDVERQYGRGGGDVGYLGGRLYID